MTDKSIVRKRFSGAFGSYDRSAVAQKEIAAELFSMIEEYVPLPLAGPVLEIGCGTGFLTRRLSSFVPADMLLLNDICPEAGLHLADVPHAVFFEGDAESLDFPSGLALIASCSVIQWFHDTAGFVNKCRSSLLPGGFLAISTFAPGNLEEVAAVSGRSLDYVPADALRNMLEDGFDVLYFHEDVKVMYFLSPVDVLIHLKRTGVNGVGRRAAWTRKDFDAFCHTYNERFGGDGGCPLTYRPLYFIARRKSGHPALL